MRLFLGRKRISSATLVAIFFLLSWTVPAVAAEEEPESQEETSTDTDKQTPEGEASSENETAPALELNASQALLIFPVAGRISYIDSWGAPRPGGRTHKGTDIFADKGTPVVAVAAGEVVSASSSDGTAGVYVKIRHSDGAISAYLHLNNDTPGTDDGQVVGIANGIEKGAFVPAGMIIGYVGDSGNAETTQPHLHFEYRPDGVNPINPFPLLQTVQGPVTADTHDSQDTLPFTGSSAPEMWPLPMVLLLAGAALLLRTRGMEPCEASQERVPFQGAGGRLPCSDPHARRWCRSARDPTLSWWDRITPHR